MALEKLAAQEKLLRSRLHLFQRCKWVLSGRGKFDSLLSDLKQHNDSLYKLCPDGAFEVMQLNLVVEYLEKHNSPAVLKKLEGPAKEASKNSQFSPSQQGLMVLNDIAELKILELHSSKPLTKEDEKLLLTIKESELQQGTGTKSNMAVYFRPTGEHPRQEAVYFERKPYGNFPQKPNLTIRDNILKLGRLLQNPVSATRLHALRCIGLAELKDDEIGMVFELPASLGRSIPRFPVADLDIRRPRAILLSRSGMNLDLGLRFEMARKLVRSIAFLHASGWLHKNIRSDAIFVFPKKGGGEGGGSSLSRDDDKMDYENPVLLGYEYSRPHLGSSTNEPSSTTPNPDPDVHRPNRVSTREDDSSEESAWYSDEDVDGPVTSEFHQINLTAHHLPAKRANPSLHYNHACDVYSLGIVLLEIGLWKRIEDMGIKKNDPYVERRALLDEIVPQLRVKCGAIYEQAVVDCLTVDIGESPAELKEQARLCAKIAAKLAECRV